MLVLPFNWEKHNSAVAEWWKTWRNSDASKSQAFLQTSPGTHAKAFSSEQGRQCRRAPDIWNNNWSCNKTRASYGDLKKYANSNKRERTDVHDWSAQSALKRPCFHSNGMTSSIIKTSNKKLPVLRVILWAWKRGVSFWGCLSLMTAWMPKMTAK